MLGDLNCNLLKSNFQSDRLTFPTIEYLTQMIKVPIYHGHPFGCEEPDL